MTGRALAPPHQVTAIDGGPAKGVAGTGQILFRDQALGRGLHHLGAQIDDAGVDQDPLLIAAEGAGQDAGDGQPGREILVVAAHHEVPLRGHLDVARGLEVHHHLTAPVQLVDEALLDLLPHPVGVLQGVEIDKGGDRNGLGQGRERLALHQLIRHAGHQPVELHPLRRLARVSQLPIDGVGRPATDQCQRHRQHRDNSLHGYLSCICT